LSRLEWLIMLPSQHRRQIVRTVKDILTHFNVWRLVKTSRIIILLLAEEPRSLTSLLGDDEDGERGEGDEVWNSVLLG